MSWDTALAVKIKMDYKNDCVNEVSMVVSAEEVKRGIN